MTVSLRGKGGREGRKERREEGGNEERKEEGRDLGLTSCRLGELDELVTEHCACLVVVDSMASLLRKEYDTRSHQGLADRSALLSRLAANLK